MKAGDTLVKVLLKHSADQSGGAKYSRKFPQTLLSITFNAIFFICLMVLCSLCSLYIMEFLAGRDLITADLRPRLGAP